jgi:hypothetical protein
MQVLPVNRAVHGDVGDLVVDLVDRDVEPEIRRLPRYALTLARPADDRTEPEKVAATYGALLRQFSSEIGLPEASTVGAT